MSARPKQRRTRRDHLNRWAPMRWHNSVLWFGLSALVLFAVYIAASLALHRRLIGRLYSQHHVLWLDLGAPTLRDVVLRAQSPPQISATGKITYFGWLSMRGYAALGDEVAARMGRDLARRGWAPRGFGGMYDRERCRKVRLAL